MAAGKIQNKDCICVRLYQVLSGKQGEIRIGGQPIVLMRNISYTCRYEKYFFRTP